MKAIFRSNGSKKNMRKACYTVVTADKENAKYRLFFERVDGQCYAAVWIGEDELVLTEIFDRFSDRVAVYPTVWKQCSEK